MEDVMYGVMLNAKIEKFVKEPPVNASKKLKASPVCCAKNLNESRIHTRCRQQRSEPYNNEHHKCVENSFSDVFYLKCSAYCFKH